MARSVRIWPAAVILLVITLLVGANVVSRHFGWWMEKLEPVELSAMLSPYYRTAVPPGPGPFPTALLFSGCEGPRDNLDRLSEQLGRSGWATIIVDSHKPRGYDKLQIWRLICSGQLLLGSERAGDVLVAIADARRMPFVDPERIALLGSSHGGWAIMDLLAIDPPLELPSNLARLPAGMSDDTLQGVIGIILYYPWCGPGNRARQDGWRHPAPALFFLVNNDAVASSKPCLAIAERLHAANIPVEVHVLDDVTHAFDQSERSFPWILEFDREATARSLDVTRNFLNRILTLVKPQ